MLLRSVLSRLVHNRYLFLLIGVACLLFVLAYQVPTPYLIDVGARGDNPFVIAFNAPEKVQSTPFRWSKGKSQVRMPGLGVGAAGRLTLKMRAYRPYTVAPRVNLFINGRALATVRPDDTFREYSYVLTELHLQSSDLVLEIRSQTFSTENDSRNLGVMVDTVRLDPPETWHRVTPAWNQVAWLTLGIISIYLLLLALQANQITAFGVAFCVAAVAGLCIAFFRLWLTPIAEQLVINIWLAGGLAVAAYWLLRRVWGRDELRALGGSRAVRWLALVLAFGIWFAYSGMVNPNFAAVDQIYRAHLMGELIQNRPRAIAFYFTNPQADAWGGSFVFPYPPTFDLLFAPLRAIAPADAQLVPLLNFIAAVLYASAVVPLYFLTLKIVPGDARAGLGAAVAWLIMPLSFLPLSDGAFPNLLGQWFALVFFASLAAHYPRLDEPRIFAALTILLLFTFLAYSPTLLFVLLLLGILLLVRGRLAHTAPEKKALRYLFVMLVCALLGAGALYYGPFVGAFVFGTIPSMWARLGQVGAVGQSPFMNGGWVLPQELIAHFRVLPVLAAIGALWFVRPLNSIARWLYGLAFVAFIPFGIAENWINLYNKHMLSILPFVVIGTGIVFSVLWRRGWIGRGFVLATIGYLTYAGMHVWFQRVYFYILPAGSGVEKFLGN